MTETNNTSNISLTGLSGNFSSPLSMSGDGKHVAFNNRSQNLLAPNPGGGWAVFVSSITESGSVAMRRISMPESTQQQQSSSNEGTNPIFARGRFAIAFQSRDRTAFFPGNSEKNAPVIYTDTSMDSSTATPPQRPALPVRQTMRVDGRPSTAIISGGVYTTADTLTTRAAAPAQLEIEVYPTMSGVLFAFSWSWKLLAPC